MPLFTKDMFDASDDKKNTYQVCGKTFHCTVCDNDTFQHRRAQLNTALATFFNFDWANKSAECLVCTKCGYVHWFLPD